MADTRPGARGPEGRAGRRRRRREAGAAARSARRERYEALFPPWALAGAGAVASLTFLFQPSLAIRAAMLLAFMAAAMASGKRVSLPATVFVSAGIVAANLLVPVGRVLARIGPLAITETALVEGVMKAVTFEGLVYASKATILPGLRIPGRFGSIVAAAFVYYDRILEYRGRVKPATLIADADALMLKVWDEGEAAPAPEARTGGPAGLAILAGVALASLAALALGLALR